LNEETGICQLGKIVVPDGVELPAYFYEDSDINYVNVMVNPALVNYTLGLREGV